MLSEILILGAPGSCMGDFLFCLVPFFYVKWVPRLRPVVVRGVASKGGYQQSSIIAAVSYTHLTLPTICSV